MNIEEILKKDNSEKLMILNEIILEVEKELVEEYIQIDKKTMQNSLKVQQAFKNNMVSEQHFNETTGYGYDDTGREVIDKVFRDVLGAEDAIARGQFISGSHALNVCLFGLLRPNDLLLSISGVPYDTLQKVIGTKVNDSSLISYGVKYEEIDLIDSKFDIDKIITRIKDDTKQKPKVIAIQKSKGYSTRKTLSNMQIAEIIQYIKEIDENIIIMVDNCYGEFVEDCEPVSYGADVIVGSLIKNLGGGIAPNGAYIAGKKELVSLCADRLTVPGQGRGVGPTLGINKYILQGLYHAPSVVGASLKTAMFASAVLEKMNVKVSPMSKEERYDIVQNILFENPEYLIRYVQGIQKGSAIGAYILPVPSPMPGYDDEIIMASGSFVSGSSIEISCDGPIRPPYIAYQQGGVTFEYGKIAVISAIKNLLEISEF